MNKLLIAIAVLGLAACGENRAISFENKNCYSEAAPGGVNIICPENTTFLANGTAGADGKDGINGTNGVDGATGATGATGLTGATGATGSQGIQGVAGRTGAQGATGAQGEQGKTGAQGETGARGVAGKDGADGKDGSDGVILSTTLAPVAGVCHLIAPGVWAKNEGMKADIYNNDQCSHLGPVGTYSDAGTICNNVSDFNEHSEDANGENCWVSEKMKVEVRGVFADMSFKVLTFN